MIGQHGQLIIDSVGHKPWLLRKWPMADHYIVGILKLLLFLNQARAWFPEIAFRKVCVCIDTITLPGLETEVAHVIIYIETVR